MTPITAYLIEPTETALSGAIKGISLRAYEVTVTMKDYVNKYTKITNFSPDVKATGIIYTIKNSTIVKGTTRATLSNKYIHYSIYNATTGTINICKDINDIKNYRSSLFATPELALAAKFFAINKNTTNLINNYSTVISTAQSNLSPIKESCSFLVDDYPEFFI